METFDGGADVTDLRPVLIVIGGAWTLAEDDPKKSWAQILADKYNWRLKNISFKRASNDTLQYHLNKVIIRKLPEYKKRGIKVAGIIFEIQHISNKDDFEAASRCLFLGMTDEQKFNQQYWHKIDVDDYYKNHHNFWVCYDRFKYQIAVFDKLLKLEGIPNYWWDGIDNHIHPGGRLLLNSMLTELTWNECHSPDSNLETEGYGVRWMNEETSERVKFCVQTKLLHTFKNQLHPTPKAHQRIAMVMEYSMHDIFKSPYYYLTKNNMRQSIYSDEHREETDDE